MRLKNGFDDHCSLWQDELYDDSKYLTLDGTSYITKNEYNSNTTSLVHTHLMCKLLVLQFH